MGAKRAFRGDNVIYRNSVGESMAVILTGGQGDAPPTAPVGVSAEAGGTLAAANYSYKYTYVKDGVESPPSAASVDATVAGATGQVTVTVTAVTGATSYRIYGRTGASFLFIAAITAPTVVYVDTNAVAVPAGAAPTADFNASFRDPYSGHTAITGVLPGIGAGKYQNIRS